MIKKMEVTNIYLNKKEINIYYFYILKMKKIKFCLKMKNFSFFSGKNFLINAIIFNYL